MTREHNSDGFAQPAATDRQKSGDVFAKKPLGTLLGKNAHDFPPESASLVSHSATPSSQAVSLAGPSGADEIGSSSSWSNRVGSHI
jgi:hypothetical protein